MYTVVFTIVFIVALFIESGKMMLPILKCGVLVAVVLALVKGVSHILVRNKQKAFLQEGLHGNIEYFILLINKNKAFDEKLQRDSLQYKFYEEIDSYIEGHLKSFMVDYSLSVKTTRGLLLKMLGKELQKVYVSKNILADAKLNSIVEDIRSEYYCDKRL